MRRTERPSWSRKLAATAMVAAVATTVGLGVGQFADIFRDTTMVSLDADRAGLVMDRDAKVRLRGVVIGRVRAVESVDDRVRLRLAIDTGQLHAVPANVTARIRSSTIFGSKTVDLALPAEPSRSRLRSGDTIRADRVQVEINSVFQRVVDVLARVQPHKLNATLGALDVALSGRGDQIGEGLADLSRFLGAVDPNLAALDRTVTSTATVTNTYAEAFGDLARILDNATRIGNTINERPSNLDALLVNVTGLANTVNGIVAPAKRTVISALADLDPVSQLLGYQSPGLSCLLRASAQAELKARSIFGEKSGLVSLNAGVLPGKEPYRFPQDLPLVKAQGPPTCAYGLSDVNSRTHTPFYVADNAPVPYQPRTTAKGDPRKLLEIMFGPAPRG